MITMKKTIGTIALATTLIFNVSCKDVNKEESMTESSDMQQEAMNDGGDMAMNDNQTANAKIVLNDYFNLKDALVGDDNAKAKELGATLMNSLKSFDASSYSDSQQTELKDIMVDAVEHAEHISESPIEHQREHFKILSKDVTDMVAITGTDMKLYEQFCPMYDGGSAWLSMNEEVRNPYYGSSMLKCGKVQREIN
ncbi:DUF3347 domain-containing protein [Nonlabens antarcticus]|uniref:DUF3347 domain-containing protein n=1 Tax=Nonlabens antarcticus TaxID=392714 RepID=UPI001891C915|nr:DUF3347 domain-containing protein [Nonlabens antarcticus]